MPKHRVIWELLKSALNRQFKKEQFLMARTDVPGKVHYTRLIFYTCETCIILRSELRRSERSLALFREMSKPQNESSSQNLSRFLIM